ncbi:MAG: DUF4373 domain-containing protein [Sphingobacteriales bacterium]|nr:MAG: DUF4373 domain-containing protein [Sphingobacteriales bacterium]
MAKTINFRQPAGLRSDERIATLISDHGALGYGTYWMIVEIMYRKEDMRIEYSDKMAKRLAALTGVPFMEFSVLLRELIEQYDLFNVKGGFLVSAIEYMKPRKKSVKAIQPVQTITINSHTDDNKPRPGNLVNQQTVDRKPVQSRNSMHYCNATEVANVPEFLPEVPHKPTSKTNVTSQLISSFTLAKSGLKQRLNNGYAHLQMAIVSALCRRSIWASSLLPACVYHLPLLFAFGCW